MAKINKGFYSLGEYLAPRKETEMHVAKQPNAKTQFVGALQPFADMIQSGKNSFRPYKSRSNRRSDALMPVRGFINLGRGIATILAATGLFFFNFVRAFVSGSVKQSMKNNFINTGAWLLNGFANVVRGLTQVAASPLSYLVRMPVRSYKSRNGFQKFEDSAEVQGLLAKAEEINKQLLDNTVVSSEATRLRASLQQQRKSIVQSLHEEYTIAQQNGQKMKFRMLEDATKVSAVFAAAANESASKEEMSDFFSIFNSKVADADKGMILMMGNKKPTAVKYHGSLTRGALPAPAKMEAIKHGPYQGDLFAKSEARNTSKLAPLPAEMDAAIAKIPAATK